jgi:hypothetical protein
MYNRTAVYTLQAIKKLDNQKLVFMKQIYSKVKLVALPNARNRFLHCSVQSLNHIRTMTWETERKDVIPSEGNVV